jgi:monovalent cation/hydrogen antiporter
MLSSRSTYKKQGKSMDNFQTIVLLMSFAVLLVGAAQKLRIPYPITLVLGGAIIGFIPGIKPINFDPKLILVVVLPPILYYSAFKCSIREFKHHWRDIFSLALGLVIVTTVVIAVIFKMLFPDLPWALAFAFGAIVSPPDAVAATTILKRFSIGVHLSAVLEDESLINDATALVLYKMAVVALFTGVFSLSNATIEFIKIAAGGVLIGVATGFILQQFSRRYLSPVVGVVFSFTIPYTAYILADSLGVSGVLAVVVNGLIGARVLIKHPASLRRVLGYATWDIFAILLNCFIFILIGTQLRSITSHMTSYQIMLYTGYGLLITFAMIAVRMIWVYGKHSFAYFHKVNDPLVESECKQILRDAAILSWSGMRGIVSLTAALALPLTLSKGNPLNGREEVIFITFVVILLTLLIPGLTLPSLMHWLKIRHNPKTEEFALARKRLSDAAEEEIKHLERIKHLNEEESAFLLTYFNTRKRLLEISKPIEGNLHKLELSRVRILRSQREVLVRMNDEGEIDDEMLTALENEIDLEEAQAARGEIT